MPSEPLAPGGFLVQAVNEGWSGRQFLRTFREAGGSIADRTAYRLLGEVKAALANKEMLAGLDYERALRSEMLTPWSAGSSGTFMYQIDIVVTDQEFGATQRMPFSYVSDRLLSPAQIVDQAVDLYQDFADDYGQTVHTGVLTGAYQMGAQ